MTGRNQGVSVISFKRWWEDVENKDLAPRVNLYRLDTSLSVQVYGKGAVELAQGSVLRAKKKQRDGKWLCRVVNVGIFLLTEIETALLKQLPRKEWTIDLIREYVVLEETRDEQNTYADLFDAQDLGQPFQGAFVTASLTARFSELLDSLLLHYKGKDLSQQFVWFEIFCFNQHNANTKTEDLKGFPEQFTEHLIFISNSDDIDQLCEMQETTESLSQPHTRVLAPVGEDVESLKLQLGKRISTLGSAARISPEPCKISGKVIVKEDHQKEAAKKEELVLNNFSAAVADLLGRLSGKQEVKEGKKGLVSSGEDVESLSGKKTETLESVQNTMKQEAIGEKFEDGVLKKFSVAVEELLNKELLDNRIGTVAMELKERALEIVAKKISELSPSSSSQSSADGAIETLKDESFVSGSSLKVESTRSSKRKVRSEAENKVNRKSSANKANLASNASLSDDGKAILLEEAGSYKPEPSSYPTFDSAINGLEEACRKQKEVLGENSDAVRETTKLIEQIKADRLRMEATYLTPSYQDHRYLGSNWDQASNSLLGGGENSTFSQSLGHVGLERLRMGYPPPQARFSVPHQFSNADMLTSQDLHAYLQNQGFLSGNISESAIGQRKTGDVKTESLLLPAKKKARTSKSTYQLGADSSTRSNSSQDTISPGQPNGLDCFIRFFQAVAENLKMSDRNVRDFARLFRDVIKPKGLEYFPSGSEHIRQKMKHQFRERRTARMLKNWTSLRVDFITKSNIEVTDYFPGAPLSEKFNIWIIQYLRSRLEQNAENAGCILELPGDERKIFVEELVRLHLIHGTPKCELWFGSLFSLADVESSIFWACRCTPCVEAFPDCQNFDKDRETFDNMSSPIPQVNLETFRLAFTKFKANQFYTLLVCHEKKAVKDLVGQKLFPGWQLEDFEAALRHSHTMNSCRICANQSALESREKKRDKERPVDKKEVKLEGSDLMFFSQTSQKPAQSDAQDMEIVDALKKLSEPHLKKKL